VKILLVNPPDKHFSRLAGPNQANFIHHPNAPPMGLLYLKAYLKQKTDFEVQLWNSQSPSAPGEKELRAKLLEFQPNLAGITTTTGNWYDARETARLIKSALPQCHIIVGGVHTSVYPEETLSQPEIDSIAIGEGEDTLLELALRLSRSQSPEGIPGIWFKSNGKIIRNPPRQVEKNLDRFPFPDRSDFSPEQYRLSADRFSRAAIIITSRGCPFHCTFCCTIDKHYRSRSPENIVAEMLACKEQGYLAIDFYDDIFNINKNRVLKLCDEIIRQKVNLPWICRCRVTPMDEEMIAKMASAGCERIQFGVESASQRILDMIKKQITPEQVRHAFSLAKKYNILTLGYFMIGFPTETREEAQATIDFAFELDPDFAMFHCLIPVPGSEIYEQAIQSPGFFGDYGREFAKNPSPNFVWRSWSTTLTETEQFKLIRSAFLKFYFRPQYIIRSLKKLSSMEEFLAKAQTAFKILTTR